MSYHLPESFLLASISAEQCVCHQEGPWVKWLARENLETNPITIKPETSSHMAEQSSWVHLPSCLLPEQVRVIQSCPTLCDPMDYTVCGILQARILWVAFPFSKGSSKPRDWTQVSCIADGSLPAEPQRKPLPSQVSCFVSMCLLGQFIPSVRQELVWGPGRGSPSCIICIVNHDHKPPQNCTSLLMFLHNSLHLVSALILLSVNGNNKRSWREY